MTSLVRVVLNSRQVVIHYFQMTMHFLGHQKQIPFFSSFIDDQKHLPPEHHLARLLAKFNKQKYIQENIIPALRHPLFRLSTFEDVGGRLPPVSPIPKFTPGSLELNTRKFFSRQT